MFPSSCKKSYKPQDVAEPACYYHAYTTKINVTQMKKVIFVHQNNPFSGLILLSEIVESFPKSFPLDDVYLITVITLFTKYLLNI